MNQDTDRRARRVTPSQVYALAGLLASFDADTLGASMIPAEVDARLRRAMPALDHNGRAHLWAAGRVDLAALGQVENGDPHLWPLADMYPPRRTSAAFEVFVHDLEAAARLAVREALEADPDGHQYPCGFCGGGGCRVCDGTGERTDRSAS